MKEMVTYTIDEELIKKVKREAGEKRRSMSSIVNQALEERYALEEKYE